MSPRTIPHVTTEPALPISQYHEDSAPLSAAARALAHELSGGADTSGMELARMVRRTARLYEAIVGQDLRADGVSGPRFMLLIRLYAEERRGDGQGISPTHLSQCQRVSKNTISSMLRGLEEQGLIERAIDAADKRVFRIRLSDAGRELVRATSPEHFARMNELAAALSEDEREQLAALLTKLTASLRQFAEVGPGSIPEHS